MPEITTFVREQHIEKALRRTTCLEGHQGLHPAPQVFYKQQDAIYSYSKLLSDGEYKQSQLSVFAQETAEGGKRCFLVDTFAGFTLKNAPSCAGDMAEANKHFYEVILWDRPCWLYFDLEFSRETNPDLDPLEVMAAFRKTLRGFCSDVLGGQLDEAGLFELESSTPKKFSRHVIVKHLLPMAQPEEPPEAPKEARPEAAPQVVPEAPFESSAEAGPKAPLESSAMALAGTPLEKLSEAPPERISKGMPRADAPTTPDAPSRPHEPQAQTETAATDTPIKAAPSAVLEMPTPPKALEGAEAPLTLETPEVPTPNETVAVGQGGKLTAAQRERVVQQRQAALERRRQKREEREGGGARPPASPCTATAAKLKTDVKAVQPKLAAPPVQLAFANNAQVGLIVRELISYAHARRHLPESLADLLWMRSPSSAARPASEERDAMLIDNGVYSRNRSFRLIYQSKFGKTATLKPAPDSCLANMHFSMQFLKSMSSFVPEGTPHFRHSLVPAGYAHSASVGIQIRPSCAAGRSQRAGSGVAGEQNRLMRFLAETWDYMKRDNEKGEGAQPSRKGFVTTMHEMSSQFFTVTLGNNNFCFCKGSSHLANKIYLVVDRDNSSFRQKCYDPDCRHYGSPWFPIPAYFMETSDDEDELLASVELPPAVKKEPDPEGKVPQAIKKEPDPECDERSAVKREPDHEDEERPARPVVKREPDPEREDPKTRSATETPAQTETPVSLASDENSSSSSSASSSSSSSSSSLRSNSRSQSPECTQDRKRARLQGAE